MAVKDFFDNLNGGARWDVGVSINRSNSLPLDANSVFASLEAAQNYAAGNPAEGTLANAYPGQVLAVVTDAETIIYYIDANMTLQPVGNTKDVMAYIGNIPEGSDAATIVEYINKKTEGIATDAALGELQRSVDAVEAIVGDEEAGLVKTSADHTAAIENLEAKTNYYIGEWFDELEYSTSDNTYYEVYTPSAAVDGDSYWIRNEYFDLPVVTIAPSAFEGDVEVKRIRLPESITSIGSGAFTDCTSLTDIYYEGTEEQWAQIYIGGGNEAFENATVHYNYDLPTYEQLCDEIGVLNGDDNVEGSVAKAVKDAVDALDYSKVENVGDGKIKIDGEEVVVYAHPEKHAIADVEGLQDALDKVLEDAQQYADDNDANTTYTLGYESKVDGEGGHPARIVLTPSNGDAQYVDATPFIKDGMIEKVELSDDGLKIVITWNTDADKGENNVTEIPLGDLVDVYTGVDGTTVKVEVSNKNEISAEVKTGSIKDGHIASDAAIAKGKLADDVQASLDLADSALQGVDGENAIDVNITDKNAKVTLKINEAEAGNVVLTQDANGLKANVDLSDYALSDDLHNHANKNLLDTYDQTNADIKDAVDKRHEHDNKTLLDAITDERVAKWDAAEKNIFDVVDTDYFEIALADDDLNELTLKDIDESKISGLTNKAGETATLAEVLAEKVDKVEGSRLITADEASKLEKLVLGENGEVTVSGKVAAGNVDGLDAWITARAGTLKGLSENNLTDTLLGKLNGIEAGAQVNVIEGITFNGVAIPVGEDKIADITYTLPIADADTLGGVKSSEAENGVKVNNDGTMTVNAINVNKLVQTTGEYLIMNGGGAAL